MTQMIRVLLKQAGGKYGYYICPNCENPAALMKFGGPSGFCDDCGIQYHMHFKTPAFPGPRHEIDYYATIWKDGT